MPNSEGLFTKIHYTSLYQLNVRVVNTVTHPSGQVDHIWYKELGHKTPSGSPMSHYPYVIKFQSIHEDNQPPVTSTYHYSTLNFLGYNSGISWQPDSDTLFKALSDYTYFSEETINGSVKISRHYNKYHLVKKEDFYSDSFLYQAVSYKYFANLNWTIDNQPDNYSLVREQKTTVFKSNDSRIETNTYDYDDYGNLLASFHEDGSSTYYEYYPIEGSGIQCPVAPNGIVRYLKSERFYLPNTSSGNSPYRSKNVEYKALAMLNNEGNFVVPVRQVNHNNDVLMTYFEDINDSNQFGRIATKSTTINGFTSQINHQYSFGGSLLSITNTLTTHDGHTTSKREDFSYLTGNMHYSHDDKGIGVTVEHDDLDRVTSERWHYNSTTKISRDYHYTIGNGQNQLSITDSTGKQKVFKFSNANNLIVIYQQDGDAKLFKSNEFEYDDHGQTIRQSSFDIVNSTTLPMHEYRAYDYWGEISQITHPDNTKEIIQNDVVAMTSTHYIEGLNRTKKEYNIVGKELTLIKYDSNGAEISNTSHEYNSAHQLIRSVDENNLETFYVYDNSERLIEQYFHDNSQKIMININYTPFSNELLATQISVNNEQVGQRSYDGLGRVVTESKFNGSSIDFEYTGSSAKADRVNTESDDTIYISYDPFWGEKVEIIINGDSSNKSSYQYDNQGRLITENNSNCDIYYGYNQLDQLIMETVSIVGSGASLTASYSYSPMGTLLQQTDFMGMSKVIIYDALSRINRTEFVSKNERTEYSIDISYDLYSRPIEYLYTNADDSFSNKIHYSTLGIESGQTTYKNNSTIPEVELSQNYFGNLKIKDRDISIKEKRNTSESMEYDQVGRLINYNTTGELAAKDNIDEIVQQSFVFDVYDNIDFKKTIYKSITDTVLVDYQYDDKNKSQLFKIVQPSGNHIFNHDLSGNLLNDEFGNQYEYDAFNRLTSIRDSFDNIINKYKYDARGFLISQCPFNNQDIYLYYQYNAIANESSSGHSTSYIGIDNKIIGRIIDEQHHQYMASDTNGSVLSTWTQSQDKVTQSLKTYTPFGSTYTKDFS